MTERYIAFDLEMPGQHEPRISAIGITVIENRKITDKLYYLVNPETEFDPYVIKLIGITPEMVRNEPPFPVIWDKIKDIMSGGILVAHGAAGDLNTLCLCLKHYGIKWQDKIPYLCTCDIGLKSFPGLDGYSLDVLCGHIGFPLNHHYALSDSEGCARLLLDYIDKGIDVKSFVSSFDFQKCHMVRKKKVKKKKKTLEEKIRKKLFSLGNEDSKLETVSVYPSVSPERVIGVSMEHQAEIAEKLIAENKDSAYLDFLPHKFLEENNIHALILNRRKRFHSLVDLLDRFLPFVDNGQTCALLMPKLFEKSQPELLPHLADWLDSENYYARLFALNVIEKHYLSTAYSDFLKTVLPPLISEGGIIKEKCDNILFGLCVLEKEKAEKPKRKRKRKRPQKAPCQNTDITAD